MAVVLLGLLTTTPALARKWSDPQCMRNAVLKRSQSTIAAYWAFGQRIANAAETQGNTEASAWDIADDRERENVIRQTGRDFGTVSSAANNDLRSSLRTATDRFRDDGKQCVHTCDSRGSCKGKECPSGTRCTGMPLNQCIPDGCPASPVR